MAPSQSKSATPVSGVPAELAAQAGKHGEGFFQSPFAQRILPFITSISVHAGIVILALLTYTAIQVIRHPEPRAYAPIANDIIGDTQTVAFAGLNNSPLIEATQDEAESKTHGASSSFTADKMVKSGLSGGGGEGDANVISVGATGFGHGLSNGLSRGNGRTGDGEGPLAKLGVPTLGGAGPQFVGMKVAATRITFVCDASGSMLNKMPSLKSELIKAISKLRPIQSFSVIFFQDNKAPMMLNSALLPATPQNKRKAADFLEAVTAVGTTEPIAGIEAAFHQHPELIFLLTDGDFPDNDAVLARVKQLNKGSAAVRINTIAFVGSGDNDTEFIGLLKTIAKDSGGDFRRVNEEELQ